MSQESSRRVPLAITREILEGGPAPSDPETLRPRVLLSVRDRVVAAAEALAGQAARPDLVSLLDPLRVAFRELEGETAGREWTALVRAARAAGERGLELPPATEDQRPPLAWLASEGVPCLRTANPAFRPLQLEDVAHAAHARAFVHDITERLERARAALQAAGRATAAAQGPMGGNLASALAAQIGPMIENARLLDTALDTVARQAGDET